MTDQDGKGLFQSLPLTRPAAPPVRELEEALILPGDRIPEFILPDANAQLQRFYELVRGRPTVLVLVANTARQEQWDEIKGYADIAPALDAAGVDLFIVTNDGVDSMAMVSKAIPAPAVWLADLRGAVNLALRTGAK
ncbi:MAG TPA: redoxin domain-containing protein, partial [Dongiaceae bacterium]